MLPLGRHGSRHRSGNSMNHTLQPQELRLPEVVYPALDVPLRCDEAIARNGDLKRRLNRVHHARRRTYATALASGIRRRVPRTWLDQAGPPIGIDVACG